MTMSKALRRVIFIIQYEPSWFAECMSATGLFFWAVFAFITDDFIKTDTALLLPLFGCLLGPARLLILFGLRAELRVFFAMTNFLVWVVLFDGLFRRYGIVPAEGLIIGVALGDVLTVGKFSLVAQQARRNAT